MRRTELAGTVMVVLLVAAGGCSDDGGTRGSSTPSTAPIAASESTTTTVHSSTPTGATPAMPLRGFAISPPDFTQEGFTSFLEYLAEGATLLEWVGDGFEWGDEAGGPNVGLGLASQAGVELITIGGWAHTEDGSLIRPLTDENVARYVESARLFAAEHRPDLMGFGVEINTHWREFPEHWDASTDLFAAVAEAIHEASPATRVFIVFQLERMKGMNGGLFGGENTEGDATWDLIDDFPDADIIGFTTYPSLVFTDPSEIPEDYYRSIEVHTDRPIAFTELGWHAAGDFAQWSGTEEAQAGFVRRFPELIEGMDVVFYTWSFLFDQEIPGIWESIGLVGRDGEERAAWDTWLEVGR